MHFVAVGTKTGFTMTIRAVLVQNRPHDDSNKKATKFQGIGIEPYVDVSA
jgi:hypothetical protein